MLAFSPIISDEGCGIWLGKKSAAKLWEEKAYQVFERMPYYVIIFFLGKSTYLALYLSVYLLD